MHNLFLQMKKKNSKRLISHFNHVPGKDQEVNSRYENIQWCGISTTLAVTPCKSPPEYFCVRQKKKRLIAMKISQVIKLLKQTIPGPPIFK